MKTTTVTKKFLNMFSVMTEQCTYIVHCITIKIQELQNNHKQKSDDISPSCQH